MNLWVAKDVVQPVSEKGSGMGLYDRILGSGWIYERLRPALLGGGPAGEVFSWLGDTAGDVIIDVGCGTGLGFDRLRGFAEYHGFDTDARALEGFRQKGLAGNVHLYNGEVTPGDLDRIRPGKAVLTGILHHLNDGSAARLLGMLAECPSLRQAITLDPVYVEGRRLNCLVCRLDRGGHVRTRGAYESLMREAGFTLARAEVLGSGRGLAFYFCTLLET